MKRPHVIVASEREGLGLVETWALKRDTDFALCAGDYERGLGLYRGDRRDLVISGVLEHHMVAACALAVRDLSPRVVVNFGASGTYGGRFNGTEGPRIGESVLVSNCFRFDVDDNTHWALPRRLEVLDLGVRQVNCITGSRYSRAEDYASPHFPRQCEIEDMELYAVAVLLETLALTLYSIKYITNQVGPEGRSQFRENVTAARSAGEKTLESLLHVLETIPE